MKNVHIEWKHYVKDGKTCTRCSLTGHNLHQAIKFFEEKFKKQDIKFILKESALNEKEINQSNSLIINGLPIEEILKEDLSVKSNHCQSCSCFAGKRTNCKAISYSGKDFDEIPQDVIKEAISIMISRLKIPNTKKKWYTLFYNNESWYIGIYAVIV